MITPAKPTVDEASVRYQARTKLAELASDISSARDLNKVNEKFLLATKIRLWLKALDYSYLTSVQRQRLVYALIDLSGIYDFPAAPVLANMPRPSILIGGGGGISGAGIPAGGTTGQILTKTSNNDYAAAWSNPSLTGSGSSNYLTKWTSATGLSTSLLYDNGTSIGLGTATPISSSILDLSSTSKGFLIPRMTTGQRDSIVSPSIGLQIYNTSTNRLNYYNGTAWTQIEIGGIPGGANTNVQYNDGGSFGGDSSFTFNETTKVLGVESIDFATAPTAADAERRLKWNNDEGTLIFQARNGNVAVPIGQEVMSLCYNDDVITLTKGTVVYVSGAQGQRVKIKRAVNTGEGTSSKTFGIVAESIAVGAEGFVMVHGTIRGLNTSAYTQGATLYLGATSGTYTTTKPFAPNHVVYVGFVVRSHPSSGEIFTKIQNGYEFAEIHDYQEGTVLDKEVISYEASTNLYKPKSIVTLLGYTPENIANKGVANGYASLDSGGKVPTTQLPFTVMEYKGVWNAAFNNPSLLNGIGNTGDIYKVSVAGTVNHGAGNITYKVGDWTIYNGSIWEKAVGSGLSIDLQGVTDNGNETDNSIVLKNVTDPTKQFEIQVLDNGNILFTGGENASLHCSGDIVAFSDGTGGGTGTGGGLGGGHVISKLLVPVPNPYTQREKLSFSAKFNVTDDPSNNATLIDIPTASLGVNLQAVTDAGNTTNDPIILTNVAGTKQVSVSVDTNGNILFNAGLDQNFHFSGDVVAFSSMSPPATSWWENMPYATASTVGGIKIGTGLTIDGNGVVSIGGGVVGQTNYSLTFNNSGSGAASGTTFNGSAARTISYNTIGAEPTLSKGNLTEATSSVLTITGGTNAVIGSGTTIQVAQSSGSVSGYLSSTDWTTFNNKVSGNGTINYIPKYTSTGNTIGNSQIRDDGTGVAIGGAPSAYRLDVTGNTKLNGTTRLTNGTNYVDISIDGNGNIIFTGETNKNFHFSGDVVAFSSLTPPVGTWWDSMPYATTTTVGGVKVDGTTITINGSGVISAVGGGGVGNVTGSGTSGYVTYWNGTSSITGESNLFWDATNDRLGIGTATPSHTLTVSGSSPRITISGSGLGSNVGLRFNAIDSGGTSRSGGYYFQPQTGTSSYLSLSGDDNNNHLIVRSDGNVGINTTTPGYKLDVNGTGRFSGLLTANSFNATDADPYLVINQTTSTNNSGIKFQTNTTEIGKITAQGSNGQMNINMGVSSGWGGYITFSTDNSEKMRLNSSGNLGLGVTPSAWGSPFKALEGGDGDNQQYIGFQTNANDLKIGTNNYYDGANYVYKFNGTATRYDISNSSFAWNLAGSGTAGNAITFTQAMTLNADGNLLLGLTTIPSAVANYRTLVLGGTDGSILDLGQTGTSYGRVSANASGLNLQALQSGDEIQFRLVNTQAMTLDSSGNLGVRTTSMSYPLTRNGITLKASGTDGAEFVMLSSADTGFTGAALIRSGADFSVYNRTNGVLAFGTNDTTRMTITSGGNVGINNTNPQKKLEVVTPASDFASVGVASLGIGEWTGIHFGYREANTSYRKSAIVFQRTDLTANDGQGKIHILNGPQGSGGSATLADAKLTITESGNISTAKNIATPNSSLSSAYISYNTTGTNGWLITTNIDYSAFNMPTVIIEGYAYGNSRPIHLEIVWYSYNDTIINHSYTNLGGWDPGTIRLGTNGNNKVCIHLSNNIYYGRFNVRCIYDQGVDYLHNWSVSDTSYTGLSRLVTVPRYALNTDVSGSAGTAVSATTAVSAGELNLGSGVINVSAWAGGSGYHGYTYSGGNYRFGFSSTSGVVDVYADGNFYATDSSHLVLHAGNYGGYSSFSGVVSAGTRFYVGYDSGETGSMSCNNWFRSSGQTGWYNATYGGGIYMEDSTWVRTYGSKSLYCNQTIRAQGDFRVGSDHSIWGTYGSNSGYLTKIAYISFDWNANYDTYASHGIASTDQYGSFTDDISINSYSDINFRLDTNNNDGSEYVRFHLHTYASNQFAYIGYTGSVFQTYFSGTLYNTGDVIAYYSDQRLKKDIRLIDSALDKLGKINGYYYRPNEKALELSADSEDKQRLGVLAQEIAEVFPEVIEHAPFDRNEDGSSKSGENYMTVKYERLVPVLIQAIKEQQNKIEELESKLK